MQQELVWRLLAICDVGYLQVRIGFEIFELPFLIRVLPIHIFGFVRIRRGYDHLGPYFSECRVEPQAPSGRNASCPHAQELGKQYRVKLRPESSDHRHSSSMEDPLRIREASLMSDSTVILMLSSST